MTRSLLSHHKLTMKRGFNFAPHVDGAFWRLRSAMEITRWSRGNIRSLIESTRTYERGCLAMPDIYLVCACNSSGVAISLIAFTYQLVPR